MLKPRFRVVSVLLFLFTIGAGLAHAQEFDRFAIEVEGAPVWLSRNDVRIPPDTGTEFSIVDLIGKGPSGAFRVEAAFNFNERHGLRAVIAPLQIEATGTPDETILFAGGTFAPGVSTDATYKFSSYRFTYRYTFYRGERWRWRIGGTAFIRDARIALQQGGLLAEDTDVGFVPLVHFSGDGRLSDRWKLLFDFEGLGSTQGRAFDIAAKLGYELSDDWELAFGYRTIEGGADVDTVYNFAWLHFAVVSLRISL
jgi:hypothetical protein